MRIVASFNPRPRRSFNAGRPSSVQSRSIDCAASAIAAACQRLAGRSSAGWGRGPGAGPGFDRDGRPEPAPSRTSEVMNATASRKLARLYFMTSPTASPCSPQPKHRQYLRPGSMQNDGLLSSWNGQRHQSRLPRWPLRPGGSPISRIATSARSTRSRIANQSSGRSARCCRDHRPAVAVVGFVMRVSSRKGSAAAFPSSQLPSPQGAGKPGKGKRTEERKRGPSRRGISVGNRLLKEGKRLVLSWLAASPGVAAPAHRATRLP